jgi:hypothetical protein
MISKFFDRRGWKLNNRLRMELSSFSDGNLWLLSYALRSLEKKGKRRIRREFVLKEVKRDLEDISLIEGDFSKDVRDLMPQLLIALSVLYRYEIPTDVSFLYDRVSYPKHQTKAALDQLVNLGEAFLQRNEGHLYGLPHAMLAELYFQVAKSGIWEEKTIYGNEEEYIYDYVLSERAINGLSLFGLLGTRFRSVVKMEGPDMEKLAHRISNCSDVESIRFCLGSFTPQDLRQVWQKVDKEKFSRTISHSEDVGKIDDILELLYLKYRQALKECCKHMNKKKVARTISLTDKPSRDSRFIARLFKFSRQDGIQLWERINKKKLAYSIFYTDDNWEIGYFIDDLFEAGPKVLKQFFRELAHIISQTDKLSEISRFVRLLSRSSIRWDKYTKQVWKQIDKEKLAHTILHTTSLSEVNRFIALLDMVDLSPQAVSQLWKHIGARKFDHRISQTDDPNEIDKFVRLLFSTNPQAEKLWEQIDKKKLADIISQVDNANDVYFLLHGLSMKSLPAFLQLWEARKRCFEANFKYGSTTVMKHNGEFFFKGDIAHYGKKNIFFNARKIRSIMEEKGKTLGHINDNVPATFRCDWSWEQEEHIRKVVDEEDLYQFIGDEIVVADIVGSKPIGHTDEHDFSDNNQAEQKR